MIRRKTKRRIRGVMLLEAMVALVLLLMVVALATQASSAMIKQRRSMQRQRTALDAKTHLATYAMALPFDEVEEETLSSYAKSLTEDLKTAEWAIQVTDENAKQDTAQEKPEGKRIRIALKIGGQRNAGRPLVCWRYPTDEQSPDGNEGQP